VPWAKLRSLPIPTAAFWLLGIAQMLPILVLMPFYTFDGPAHLHNAQLIRTLLSDAAPESVTKLLGFNPSFPPNQLGHVLLVLLGWVLPALWTEKLVLLAILILYFTGTWAIVRRLNAQNNYLALLPLPMASGLLFLMGFMNYCLAVGLLLWVVWWLLRPHPPRRWFAYLGLAALLLLLYLSHPVCLGLAVGATGLWGLRQLYQRQYTHVALATVAALPATGLMALNVLTGGLGTGEPAYLPAGELLRQWLTCQPRVFYLGSDAGLSWLLLPAVWGTIGVGLWVRWRQGWRFQVPDALGGIALLCVALLFILPDDTGTAGFIAKRLVSLSYLFGGLYAASLPAGRWVRLWAGGIAAFVMLSFIIKDSQEQVALSRSGRSIIQVSDHLPDGAVVLPLNYSSNWLHFHLSNYAAISRPVVMMENYEAEKPYFPLLWRHQDALNTLSNEYGHIWTHPPCAVPGSAFREMTGQDITHILMIAPPPADSPDICPPVKQVLAERYTLVAQQPDGFWRLYGLKTGPKQ